MSVVRHVLGILVVWTGARLAEVGHWWVHAGAWLMDREDVLADCVVCQIDREELGL